MSRSAQRWPVRPLTGLVAVPALAVVGLLLVFASRDGFHPGEPIYRACIEMENHCTGVIWPKAGIHRPMLMSRRCRRIPTRSMRYCACCTHWC
jgi:hypothetical protein